MGGVSVRVVLLCEDRQTDSFVRRFLSLRSFASRDIDTRPLTEKGSAEQLVRKRYPKELKAIRVRRNAFLIVIIDADACSTDARRAQLDEECERQGIPKRMPHDPVIIMVPRRNIETWLEYLRGEEIDETTAYRKLRRESDCAPLARELYRMCYQEQKLAEPAPPSLLEACQEYQKLKR